MDCKGFEKGGVEVEFTGFDGEAIVVELVRDEYYDGSLAVTAYVPDWQKNPYMGPYTSVTTMVETMGEPEDGVTHLNANAYSKDLIEKVKGLGELDGNGDWSGRVFYPTFRFRDDVLEAMRDIDEFLDAHPHPAEEALETGIEQDAPSTEEISK